MPIFKQKNENFFKTWSAEMAYVLGFFAADGNLTLGKRGNHYVEFTSCDYELIVEIRKLLGSNHKIGEHEAKGNARIAFRIQIGSKKMFNDLVNLGFMPTKSLILPYPAIPKKFLHHFVRGYFDGDGHVWQGLGNIRRKKPVRTVHTVFTSGSRKFLLGLQGDLARAVKSSGSLLEVEGKYYRLQYSVKASLSLYKFMYNNATLYLARKRLIFEEFMKLRA